MRIGAALVWEAADGGQRAGVDLRAANEVAAWINSHSPQCCHVTSINNQSPLVPPINPGCQAADEVGAVVAMGDRPIELSFARFLYGLSLFEKVVLSTSLVSLILRGLDKDAAVEARRRLGVGAEGLKVGEDALVDVASLLEEKDVRVPTTALAALTNEREEYFAWSLKR